MKDRRSTGESVRPLDDQGVKDVPTGKKDLESQWILCFGLFGNIEVSTVIMSLKQRGWRCSIRSNSGKGAGCSTWLTCWI